jgi:outer membrane protein OmpU
MKKLLLGATALAVISSAGAALAQGAPATTVSTSNFNARIGGFMTAGIGYVDSDAHDAGVEVVNNAEVIFNFSLVSDNGITFGAKVEFEAQGTSENADEYVASAQGVFGRIEIGREDGAADTIGRAPGNTAFTAAADEGGLLFDYASAESPAVVPSNGADTGDTLKITYYTPTFAGFRAGVSYVPGGDSSPAGSSSPREFNQGGTSTNGANDDPEAFELGATYKNTFGGVSLNLGAAYVSFEDSASTGIDDSYTFVASVGFAGFTVGGSYYQTNGADQNATAASATAPANTFSRLASVRDVEAFAVGAGYTTGPWNFGIQYAQILEGFDGVTRAAGTAATRPETGLGGDASDDFGISVGADYALAPGVTVGVVGEYADGTRLDSSRNESDEAFAAGVFMGLSF